MHADPALPGSGVLLGPDPRQVLAPAVAAAGGRLRHARATQMRYRPGRRLAVRYAADIEWSDGTQRTETLGALVQTAPLPDDLAVLEDGDGARVGVWRYPHDPFLPGLPAAAYPVGARQVLARLGIDVAEVDVEPIVYRPGSRAVLRITAPGRCVYVKVVRPGGATAIRQVHDALAAHARVPRCLAVSDPLGLVVLEALGGEPLTRPLVDGGTLPPPDEVLALSRALAPADLATEAEAAGVDDHGALLDRALPEAVDRIAAVASYAADQGADADRTVHGDFYGAQVLVTDGAVTGLLDLDGVRAGNAADDPATLVGHLTALAHVHPGSAARITPYARAVEMHARTLVDADLLHRSVAGVLLGLATTSFRRQEDQWPRRTLAWLELAEAWTARRPDGALA